ELSSSSTWRGFSRQIASMSLSWMSVLIRHRLQYFGFKVTSLSLQVLIEFRNAIALFFLGDPEVHPASDVSGPIRKPESADSCPFVWLGSIFGPIACAVARLTRGLVCVNLVFKRF